MVDFSHLQELLSDPAVQELLASLRSASIEGRLVGGCVRDALLGFPCADIDIAVDRPPNDVLESLQKANLRVIPTGLQHGTLTVLVRGRAIEVTSLRQDVVTDGRHAEVRFTSAWEEDAARRDFTFNALYCDASGQIYDYFSGLDDLTTHTLRFIGDPSQRIQEDFLRILRYYRFQLRYGQDLHEASHKAVRTYVPQLPHLSNERIQAELIKIVSHPEPVTIVRLMDEDGVFETLFGVKARTDVLEQWRATQQTLDASRPAALEVPFAWGKLFALFPQPAEFFQRSLRLSRKEAHLLTTLHQQEHKDLSAVNLFALRFEEGDALAWLWLLTKSLNSPVRNDLLEAFQTPLPAFPLKGADLIADGLASGPDVGRLFKACQQQWIQQQGKWSHEDCLAFCRSQTCPKTRKV